MTGLAPWARRATVWLALAGVLLLGAHPVFHAHGPGGCAEGPHGHAAGDAEATWTAGAQSLARCPVCVLQNAGVCLAAPPAPLAAPERGAAHDAAPYVRCPVSELEAPRSRGPPLPND